MILKKTILVTNSRRKSVFYESIGKMLSNCIELKSIICLVLKIDRSLKENEPFSLFRTMFMCVHTDRGGGVRQRLTGLNTRVRESKIPGNVP